MPDIEGVKAIYRRWSRQLYPKSWFQLLDRKGQNLKPEKADNLSDEDNKKLKELIKTEYEKIKKIYKEGEWIIPKDWEEKKWEKPANLNYEEYYSVEKLRAYFGQQRSRLQIYLEDLRINGSNEYHESLLRFEGSVINSTIQNIQGNCSTGGKPKYDSILLHFDDGNELINSYPKSSHLYAFDNVGFQYGHIENIGVNLYNGYGFHSIFKGRINRSSIINAHAIGGALETPAFYFSNSFESELINLTTEGIAEKPIYKL